MATYYVAKSGDGGNNANPGTSVGSPKLTIAAGLALLSAGDTLYIRRGTYAEGDLNPISGSSTSVRTTISAYPGDSSVTIQTPGGSDRCFRTTAKSYITIYGLILDNASGVYDCIKLDDDGGGNYSHHIRIQNCEIKNAPNNGILEVGSPGGTLGGFNEILNCNIHNNATFNFSPYAHAIYITSKSNIVEGNTIHDHNSDTAHNTLAVHIYNSGSGGLDGNIVRKNTIYNMTRGGGILIADGTGCEVSQNVISGSYTGITVFGSAVSAGVYHNTITSCSLTGVGINSGASGTTVRGNISYNNGTNYSNAGSGTTEDHDLTANPIFVDATAQNFRLTASSVNAIKQGTDLSSLFTTDLDGNPRVAPFDLGAFEYTIVFPGVDRRLIASDSFAGSSVVALGGNWQQLYPSTITMYRNSSGFLTASPAVGDIGAARWVANAFSADQYSSLEFKGVTAPGISAIGVIARASGDIDGLRDFYYFVVAITTASTDTFSYFGKFVNGVDTPLLDRSDVPWAVSDRIELECDGTTIRALRSNIVVFSVTDTDLTTGAPGVAGTGAFDATGDNWEGGNLHDVSAPSVPAHKGRRFTFLRLRG